MFPCSHRPHAHLCTCVTGRRFDFSGGDFSTRPAERHREIGAKKVFCSRIASARVGIAPNRSSAQTATADRNDGGKMVEVPLCPERTPATCSHAHMLTFSIVHIASM